MSDIRFNRWLHQSGTGGVYQDGSGRVGIGSSVPSEALTVVGNINASGVTVTGDLNIAGVLTYDDVTNIDSIGVITARSGVHVTSGSVGIGTDSPANKLEVGGAISAVDLFVTSGGDTTSNNISGKFSHGGINTKSLVIGADPNNVGGNTRLQFDVDGTERMRITSDGSVGIGTDTPTEKLEIRDGGLLINGSNLTGILTEDVFDDTFVSIDLTQPGFVLGGLLLITTLSGGANPFVFPQPTGTGLVYYDCGNSLLGARILADADTGANPLLGGTTSTSTTITDFTDSRVTIICNTNTLRIANRIGGTRRFKLTFL